MKEEFSEATLFRTTEESALRVYFRKPNITICCGLWQRINYEHHHTYTGQQNPYQDWYLTLVFR